MANHKSAKKRAKQNEVKNLRNKAVKTTVKNAIKKIRLDAEAGSDPSKTLDSAKSVIDKAAKKGVIHKRSAARKISRLSKLVNSKSV
ncbi:MAG: 30S ribosomal protein S20 [Desulfobacterales bacterium]